MTYNLAYPAAGQHWGRNEVESAQEGWREEVHENRTNLRWNGVVAKTHYTIEKNEIGTFEGEKINIQEKGQERTERDMGESQNVAEMQGEKWTDWRTEEVGGRMVWLEARGTRDGNL